MTALYFMFPPLYNRQYARQLQLQNQQKHRLSFFRDKTGKVSVCLSGHNPCGAGNRAAMLFLMIHAVFM
jgi:hypothetical protein